MTAAWPNTLPQQPLRDSYQEAQEPAFIRSEVDAGPAKVRRRFTAPVTRVSMQFRMTPAQVTTFETWWRDTIKLGSLSFTLTHPRTSTSTTWRNVEPYRLTPLAGDRWLVQLSLEILP